MNVIQFINEWYLFSTTSTILWTALALGLIWDISIAIINPRLEGAKRSTYFFIRYILDALLFVALGFLYLNAQVLVATFMFALAIVAFVLTLLSLRRLIKRMGEEKTVLQKISIQIKN